MKKLYQQLFISITGSFKSFIPQTNLIQISINLLAIALYHECCSLIGYATHFLSAIDSKSLDVCRSWQSCSSFLVFSKCFSRGFQYNFERPVSFY